MAVEIAPMRTSGSAIGHAWRGLWRGLLAVAVIAAVGRGGVRYGANNSVQGAKKDEGAFDGDAPTAILVEASSGSVLFEKNADELRAAASRMKMGRGGGGVPA